MKSAVVKQVIDSYIYLNKTMWKMPTLIGMSYAVSIIDSMLKYFPTRL